VIDAEVSAKLQAPVIECCTEDKRPVKSGSGVRALKAAGGCRKPSGRNPSRFFVFFFGGTKKKIASEGETPHFNYSP